MTTTYCTADHIRLVEPRSAEHWPTEDAADFDEQRVEAKRKIDLALERKGLDPAYVASPTTYLRDAEVYCVLADLCWASRARGGTETDTWRSDGQHYNTAFENELQQSIGMTNDEDDVGGPAFLPRMRLRRC